MSADEKMGWITAQTIVAMVTHDEGFTDGAMT